MKINTILLCTVAVSLGACSSYDMRSSGSGPRYTPRVEVMQKDYTAANRVEDHADKMAYKKYEQREPCERYRRLPRNYVDSCVHAKPSVTPPPVIVAEKTSRQVINTYTILFDFDKDNIRPGEEETLNRIAREIKKYNPQEVTVTGYTDSSGKVDYNQTLSRDREQSVSRGLLQRGIANKVLDREARGEYDQAVHTEDGVKNQENRRVVVDFWR